MGSSFIRKQPSGSASIGTFQSMKPMCQTSAVCHAMQRTVNPYSVPMGVHVNQSINQSINSEIKTSKHLSMLLWHAGLQGDTGTRPGPYGVPVISSGIDDLDKIFGGGIPLGTLTIISQDGWTNHDSLLCNYFISEGVAVGHSIQIIVPETRSCKGFEDFVLRDLTKRDAEKEIAAERAEEEAAKSQTRLRIAWQYEKYSAKSTSTQLQNTTQRPALGISNTSHGIRTKSPWCHHFDISKAPDRSVVEDKIQQNTNASIEKIQTREGRVVGQIVKKVKEFIDSLNKATNASQTIGRIVIQELGGLAWDSLDARHLVNLLVHLRHVAQQSSKVSIVITVPIHQLETSDAARVKHIADSYIELEAVEDISQVVKLSTDSKTVAGHLEIYKLAVFGATKSSRPQITSYIVRNKRKRLYIQPVEVDPDAEMQTQQDAQPKNPLDF